MDDLMRLRNLFNMQSEAISSLWNTVQSALHTGLWIGPDEYRFRDKWDGEHRAALKKLQDDLDQAARSVQNQWDRIQEPYREI